MKRKRKNSNNEEHSNSTPSSSSTINKNISNSFKDSLKEFANLLNISENNKEKDVTNKFPQKKKRLKINRKSLRNSVIIINDSESESNDADKVDNSVCIIECDSSIDKTSLQLQSPVLKHQKRQIKILKQKRKSSVILVDDNLPSASSRVQKSLEDRDISEKNIAPENKQAEDDVVELWSCMGEPSHINKKASNECKNSQTGENAFTIDKRPNLKNLDYIKIDTSPVYKRHKKWHYHNEDLPIKKFDMHKNMTWKLSKKGQMAKKTNGTHNQSNTRISKSQSQKSEKENSNKKHKLREIIIDGCNVAMNHTNGKKFSEKGIKLVIDYFESRGHVVKVFLPQHYRRNGYLLEELYTKGIVIFTPSRKIAGKRITPYDDRFILDYATKCEGIIISSDQYRDLYEENPEWRDTICNRLLTPTFVGDYIMFPVDPLGKSGPDLETFLRH